MPPLIEHRDLRSWQQCLLVVNADSCRSLVIHVRDIPQLGCLLSEWRPVPYRFCAPAGIVKLVVLLLDNGG
jgi:hypothetical protein